MGVWGGNTQETVVQQLFPAKFQNRPIPHQATISRLVCRFEETGSVQARKKSGRPKSATSQETATAVLAAIEAGPHSSVRQLSSDAGISTGSVHSILKKAGYHPYKLKFVQELGEGDSDRRIEFCEWALEKANADRGFLFNLCMSDESTFSLHREVNTQNWSDTNPHWMAVSHTQFPKKLNVWAGICRGRIVGPFFLPKTLTGEAYLNLLVNSIGPSLADIAGDEPIWFQHDGAPPHFAGSVRDFLDVSFPGTWIGRRGPQEWPPRSPDLSTLDFFFWGYLKSKVYNNRPQNLDGLRQRIIDVSAAITPQQQCNKNFITVLLTAWLLTESTLSSYFDLEGKF